MGRMLELLGVVWLPGLLLLAGLAALALGLRRRSEGGRPWGWLAAGGALTSLGLGGLAVGSEVGFWVATAAALLLFGLVIWLVLSGQWYAPVAAALGVALGLGLGGWLARDTGGGLVAGVRLLLSAEIAQPAWLFLLLLIPLIVLMSYRSL